MHSLNIAPNLPRRFYAVYLLPYKPGYCAHKEIELETTRLPVVSCDHRKLCPLRSRGERTQDLWRQVLEILATIALFKHSAQSEGIQYILYLKHRPTWQLSNRLGRWKTIEHLQHQRKCGRRLQRRQACQIFLRTRGPTSITLSEIVKSTKIINTANQILSSVCGQDIDAKSIGRKKARKEMNELHSLRGRD